MNLSRDYQFDVLQDRFALKVAARLSDGSDDLPHDITERLRHARVQALARRKTAPAMAPVAVQAGHRLVMLGGQEDEHVWLRRLGSVLALVLLVGGLKWIGMAQDDIAAREIAILDADLLIDDLPPAAYTDPGFGQFLRLTRAQRP